MKEKKCVILICSVLIFVAVLLLISSNDSQQVDGVFFAATLDGNKITTFPERGKYFVDVKCRNATGQWSAEE